MKITDTLHENLRVFLRLSQVELVKHFSFFFYYSRCFHFDHSVSVESFVSLQFLNHRQSVGLIGRGISSSQGRYLTQTQNKRRQTSMPWMVFEPTIPAFERAKTGHALDHAGTLIVSCIHTPVINQTYLTQVAYTWYAWRAHVRREDTRYHSAPRVMRAPLNQISMSPHTL
jgi:hypothetical protein